MSIGFLHLNQILLKYLSQKAASIFLDKEFVWIKKTKFTEHIEEVKQKLAMQCGIMSKLRNYVQKPVLLQFYSSNIKPINQYDVLIYGCVTFNL